ncbi:uncharacterized protein LOC129592703 [Paramacrobiotus metropolitanus]|uniref:uncharacterized protein LOC129592703 n=1 Tax=Paramacrobiotus metropolitanus TaxID=2943436 RepID=UPI0024457315|nr:uncharacterized protein LOC129592703 [Paramacrobiotus metropolitanus]
MASKNSDFRIKALRYSSLLWLLTIHACGYFTALPRKCRIQLIVFMGVYVTLQFAANLLAARLFWVPPSSVSGILLNIPNKLLPFTRACSAVTLLWGQRNVCGLMSAFVFNYKKYLSPVKVTFFLMVSCMLASNAFFYATITIMEISSSQETIVNRFLQLFANLAQNSRWATVILILQSIFGIASFIGFKNIQCFVVLWPLLIGMVLESLNKEIREIDTVSTIEQARCLQEHAEIVTVIRQLNKCFSWIQPILLFEDAFAFIGMAQIICINVITSDRMSAQSIVDVCLTATMISAQISSAVFLYEKNAEFLQGLRNSALEHRETKDDLQSMHVYAKRYKGTHLGVEIAGIVITREIAYGIALSIFGYILLAAQVIDNERDTSKTRSTSDLLHATFTTLCNHSTISSMTHFMHARFTNFSVP